ncbi:MAG: redoxin family protein [Planctomycetota bacterium]|jgi:peroxiredoxin
MRYRSILTSVAALAVVSAVAVAAPQESKSKAQIGEAAPAFTLKDTAGKAHTLSDFKGKTVVMQWINPDCPVCRRVMSKGQVADMIKELKAIDNDVVFLAVNSTHYMEASKSAAYFKSHKITAPALIDQDGTVGRAYGARTTPHVFVIDGKGILRYQGAFDDDARGSKGKDANNFVVNAVRQISAGETVSPDSTRPYGCSVKYKK